MIEKQVFGIETIPGTPEPDTTRLYTNEAHTEWVDINYDEAKAGVVGRDFALEDPLTFADGRRVESAADWAERRRELLALFEREVYGRMPPKPAAAPFALVSERTRPEFGMTERRYRQWFRADHTGPAIDWIAFLPCGAERPCPAFLHLNYQGNDIIATGNTNHFALPLADMAARGFAFLSAHYIQITSDGPERGGAPFSGVFELWGVRGAEPAIQDTQRGAEPAIQDGADATGSLMAWAWGLCRGLDLAEAIPEIDARRCTVIGSSRLGKAALLAAAFDERFAACVANQTGAVGVQLMKRDYGENLAAQRLLFPWWYCPGVWKWAGREREMPFDQHLLLACVAPRALLLECYHKKWFDPRGEWLAAKAASPVWEFLAGRGLDIEEWPAPYDAAFASPPFGYVRRTGTHGLSPDDWRWAMDFADSNGESTAEPPRP